MKKYLLLIAVIISISLLSLLGYFFRTWIPRATNEGQTPAWQTYQNGHYGFRIRYPAAASVIQEQPDGVTFAVPGNPWAYAVTVTSTTATSTESWFATQGLTASDPAHLSLHFLQSLRSQQKETVIIYTESVQIDTDSASRPIYGQQQKASLVANQHLYTIETRDIQNVADEPHLSDRNLLTIMESFEIFR